MILDPSIPMTFSPLLIDPSWKMSFIPELKLIYWEVSDHNLPKGSYEIFLVFLTPKTSYLLKMCSQNAQNLLFYILRISSAFPQSGSSPQIL